MGCNIRAKKEREVSWKSNDSQLLHLFRLFHGLDPVNDRLTELLHALLLRSHRTCLPTICGLTLREFLSLPEGCKEIKRVSDIASSGKNSMDRRVTISFVAIVLFLSSLFSVSVVNAHRFDIDITLQTGEHYEIHKDLTNGSRIVGNYSHGVSGWLYFFICNSTNFMEWSAGNVQTNMVESIDSSNGMIHEFDVIVPHADTWYVVFSNEHSFSYALLSGYVDFPDVPPYRLLFEVDEWISPSDIYPVERGFYAVGTEVEVGHVISQTLMLESGSSGRAFLCDSFNFYDFGMGETYSSYEEQYLYSIGAITYSFEVPHSDTWYVVIHNYDFSENIRVTGSGYFEVMSQSATYTFHTKVTQTPQTTSPNPTSPNPFAGMDSVILIGGSSVVVAVILIAIVLTRKPKTGAAMEPYI